MFNRFEQWGIRLIEYPASYGFENYITTELVTTLF
jgi:hypothetical protein